MSSATLPRLHWRSRETSTSSSRRIGLEAGGLAAAGCFCVVLALLLPLWVYPRLVELPLDPQENEVQTATNATVLVPDLKAAAGAKVLHGATVTITTFVSAPKVGSFPSGTAVWLLATRVNVGGVGLLQAQVERVSLDRRTAEPTNCCGDTLVTDQAHPGGQPLDHQGYVAWPFDLRQRSYPLWTVSLYRARQAIFTGVEHRQGVRVYRYVAHNDWVDTGTQALPGALFGLTTPSVTATAQYADTQTSWVEPNSGAPVDMTEHVQQRFVYQGRAVTAMDADLISSPLPAARMTQIREGTVYLPWIRRRASIVLGLVAIGFLTAAAVLVRRGRSHKDRLS